MFGFGIKNSDSKAEHLPLVRAIQLPAEYDSEPSVLRGIVASYLNPTGYVTIDGRALFPAEVIDPPEPILLGQEVFIERPEAREELET